MNSENRIEQVVGLSAVLVLVLGCFLVLRPFVSALLLALILSYSTWPIYARAERSSHGSKGLAALSMTLLVAAVLLLPLIVLGSSLADQVEQANGWMRRLFSEGLPDPPVWIANIPLVGAQVYRYWQGMAHNTTRLLSDLTNLQWLGDVGQYLLPAGGWLLSGAAMLGQGTLELALCLFIAFFFYRDGIDGANRLNNVASRLWGERALRLLAIAGATVKGVVYGVMGTAIAQSILTAAGLLLAGVPGALVLGFLTFFVALTPSVPRCFGCPRRSGYFTAAPPAGRFSWCCGA